MRLIFLLFAVFLLNYNNGHAQSIWGSRNNSPAVNSQAALSSLNVFTPSNNTCTADVSSELAAFMVAHGGYATARDGDCLKIGDLGSTFVSSQSKFHLNCPTYRGCRIETGNDKNAALFWVPDTTALDSKSVITGKGTATINKDDAVSYYWTVSDASLYHVGDYVKLLGTIGVSDDAPTTKTISDVSWDAGNSKCVITTSAAHGYSATAKIFIKGVTATVGGTKIDYLDGSDGLGRTYNITLGDGAGANTTTKFTLQSIDMSTDTTSGTDINCDTGTWASGGSTSRQNTWASEGNRVAGVDTIQDRIYFATPPYFDSLYVVDTATGNVPVLYRYTGTAELTINNFEFGVDDSVVDPLDPTITTSDAYIDIMGINAGSLTNLYFDNSWDAGIMLRSSPGFLVHNIHGEKMPNRATIVTPASNSKIITDISRASQAVITFYNESGASGNASTNSETALTNMPSGDWLNIGNKIYRVANPSGSTCTDAGNTCTFKLVDTYGNYLDTSAFGTAFSGTAAAGEPDNVTGLGYLISLQGDCYMCQAEELYQGEGRHLVTTGTSQLSLTSALSSSASVIKYGVPTYATIRNATSYGANGRAIDTHEAAYKLLFDNIRVSYPHRGPTYGSYEGACGQDRGGDNTWNNIICEGGKQGIRFVANNKFKPTTFNLSDISVSGLKSADGSDKGIEIQNWSAYTNKPTFNLSGKMNFDGVTTPISLGKTAIIRSNADLNFKDFDDAVDCAAGATFESWGGFNTDFRDPGEQSSWTHKTDTGSNGFNAVISRSDGTYGGCTTILTQRSNTQGTGSNKLANWIYRADATATQYFWLGDAIERDPSSVGQPARLSNATSMSELTDVINRRGSDIVFTNGKAIQTSKTAADTVLLQAYDVDGTAYTTFGTLTANNTPTLDLSTSVTVGSAGSLGGAKLACFSMYPTTVAGDVAAGTKLATALVPAAFTVTNVYASVNTAGTTSTETIDINEDGTTIISTKLTIDATETTSLTAATPAVISDSSIAAGAILSVDVDSADSGNTGAGLEVKACGYYN